MIRKTIFWTHLVCGVAVGLVVLMMSVTGVLLTYERQLVAWADSALDAPPPPGAASLPVASLVGAVKTRNPDFEIRSVHIARDPAAPAQVSAGRSGSVYVNRYTGEVLGPGATGLRSFFGTVEGWHRWFDQEGEHFDTARMITGASNLLFLGLILTGMYLWLPRVYKWAAFKTRLTFNPETRTAKARDFNWHHVFGIWSAIPLIVVVGTAVVFSYGWANKLVYASFGEEAPVRGRRAPPPAAADLPTDAGLAARSPLPLDALFDRASNYLDDWNSITLVMPDPGASNVSFRIDQGDGGQPQLRHELVLDAYTGDVAAWKPFSSRSPGSRARSMIRFLHTGEALGIIGQTIAGLVSLTSIIMVWTGLALAYRRLIVPLYAKQRR